MNVQSRLDKKIIIRGFPEDKEAFNDTYGTGAKVSARLTIISRSLPNIQYILSRICPFHSSWPLVSEIIALTISLTPYASSGFSLCPPSLSGPCPFSSTLPTDRVSHPFPVRLFGCEKPSDALFVCIEKQGEAFLKTDSAGQYKDLSECAKEIQAYNNCVLRRKGEKRNKKFDKVQDRVPEE